MTVGTHDRGGIPAHPDGACSAPNVGVLFSLKNSAGACDVGMGRASCTFELRQLSVFTVRRTRCRKFDDRMVSR